MIASQFGDCRHKDVNVIDTSKNEKQSTTPAHTLLKFYVIHWPMVDR